MVEIRVFDEKRNCPVIMIMGPDDCLRISSLQRWFRGATALYYYRDDERRDIVVWVKYQLIWLL